ncbi:MAG: phosphoribosylformylglycinamidine synthase [bacterium]|nr:MAG: phosphoribosylformylglycinamidine synthase [bacterium]
MEKYSYFLFGKHFSTLFILFYILAGPGKYHPWFKIDFLFRESKLLIIDKLLFFKDLKYFAIITERTKHFLYLQAVCPKSTLMIYFYSSDQQHYIVVKTNNQLSVADHRKLNWLFGGSKLCPKEQQEGFFVGPRKEMITPWSTNAVEITQNMGITGILRVEKFEKTDNPDTVFDPMLQQLYNGLAQQSLSIDKKPEPIKYIEDIKACNERESLALSEEEVAYLEEISKKLNRKLTDSEIYGFAQINSEHCRHKIFNGSFVIDGKEMPESLFALIKKTSKVSPGRLVSAYKDNVAFVAGPKIEQFAPARQDKADFFEIREISSVLSLKAETHNFPTTVEPFNGAATGSGGEIRDRMAGGKGSIPLAGTAVYMTSYPRLDSVRPWENNIQPRSWLYHAPDEILIKASNGASDFGNKFGQPLINGSLLTFEHEEGGKTYAYDKVVMQAGGVGFANKKDSQKETPEAGDIIVVLGGDNYRIGMGGGAVSSVATGQYGQGTELNAVQRANPEMQKRVANAIRAMVESEKNPIVSIHDHGAGGHLNSLSELVEETGAVIDIGKLPLGDPTLSFKEILGNESQERMGLVIKEKDLPVLENIALRERAPLYKVGEVKTDHRLVVKDDDENACPVDLKLEYLFGKPPRTVLNDTIQTNKFKKVTYEAAHFEEYLIHVLHLEAVASKDWLTNKVDRSVTGRVALQQCAGPLQLPLNNLGVMALDYQGEKGIATALGHASAAALSDAATGSRLAISEALTNLLWTPVEGGLSGVSLSANWMWPARNPGENARLYAAVKAVSDFAIALGIPIPTGKDSLSMTQKYGNGKVVYAPGTVIISAVGEVSDIRKSLSPVVKTSAGTKLIYVDLSLLGFGLAGSSFAQTLNRVGQECPDVKDAAYFRKAFNALQQLIVEKKVLAGHDVSAGGLITTLLEMNFANIESGMEIITDPLGEKDFIRLMFSEKPAVVIQVADEKTVEKVLNDAGVVHYALGKIIPEHKLKLHHQNKLFELDIVRFRDIWYQTSYLFDQKQTESSCAHARFKNFKRQDLQFHFRKNFSGKIKNMVGEPANVQSPVAAIIREKGVNGDREMAYALYLAGFRVKDIHMTDLISGREDLSDVGFMVFVGGFSNSDVLGSAKGWAGAFLYNAKARKALDDFYERNDTLSLGVCNGCQLMIELDLVYPDHPEKPRMLPNDSGKFESGFINVNVHENNSVMLKSLAGQRLGVWVAHGEGKFSFPYYRDKYCIPVSYSYEQYPGNPNGSDWGTAAVCSNNGRHLAMMPHLERSVFPWQWAFYASGREKDEASPWLEAFVNARNWLKNQKI